MDIDVSDSVRFYPGEAVDTIASFKLDQDLSDSIMLLTSNQSESTISLWIWDHSRAKKPAHLDSFKLSSISCVRIISTDADSVRFVVSSEDGLYLFQVAEPLKIEKIVGPVGHGNALSFDVLRNGLQLLAAGEDGFMRFYSTKDLKHQQSIRSSASSVRVARFATDTLIFCASTNKVELWDLGRSNTQPILFLEPAKQNNDSHLFSTRESVFIWDICVHPDQPFICAAVDSLGNFSIWDLRKNKLAKELLTSKSVDFSSDTVQYALHTTNIHEGNAWSAKFINTMPNFIVTCGEDGTVVLVDLEPLDLNPAFLEKVHIEKQIRCQKLSERFSGVSDFAIEGDIVLIASEDESISVKTLPIF